MQTLVQQLWHVMYVVTLVRVYMGRSCADYSVTYFKGITIFDISELLYRVGLMYTASILYKVHVSLDLVQVQWRFKHSDVF